MIPGETIRGEIKKPIIIINSVLSWIICENYRNENSNLNILCNPLVQTKTSFSQIETKDHESLFDKGKAKFKKHLTDKGNKSIFENFQLIVKIERK